MRRIALIACGTVVALAGCGSSNHQESTKATAVNAPVIRTIAVGFWQKMRIQVQERPPTAIYFASQQIGSARSSFDLEVLLTDRDTGKPLPYAQVSGTITHNGQIVFKARLEPTLPGNGISDYETDVKLQTAGTYELTLTVGSPSQARHIEYRNVWALGATHRMTSTFTWK